MKVNEGKHLGPWKILPPPPDVCQECAVEHAPELPHNAQSMAYRYWFHNEHRRWPNWKDAMAHCTPEMKSQLIDILSGFGVDVEGGEVNPSGGKKKSC